MLLSLKLQHSSMGVFHVFKIVQTVPNGATHHKPKGPKFSLKKPTLHIIWLYEIKLVLNNRQLNRNKIPFNFWRSNTLWYQKTIYMHKNTTSPCKNKLKRLVYCLGIFHSGTSFEISVHFGTQSNSTPCSMLMKKDSTSVFFRRRIARLGAKNVAIQGFYLMYFAQ